MVRCETKYCYQKYLCPNGSRSNVIGWLSGNANSTINKKKRKESEYVWHLEMVRLEGDVVRKRSCPATLQHQNVFISVCCLHTCTPLLLLYTIIAAKYFDKFCSCLFVFFFLYCYIECRFFFFSCLPIPSAANTRKHWPGENRVCGYPNGDRTCSLSKAVIAKKSGEGRRGRVGASPLTVS